MNARPWHLFTLLLSLYLLTYALLELTTMPLVVTGTDLNWLGSILPTLLLAMMALSLLLASGQLRRWVALALWGLWAVHLAMVPSSYNVSVPWVGWLLLAVALCSPTAQAWQLPKGMAASSWLVAAVFYAVAGFGKLTSPAWLQGDAITYLLQHPLARQHFVTAALLKLPTTLLTAINWGVLLSEMAFAPLCCFHLGRQCAWWMMTLLHLGLLCCLNFTQLSLAMLLVQFWLWLVLWQRPAASESLG